MKCGAARRALPAFCRWHLHADIKKPRRGGVRKSETIAVEIFEHQVLVMQNPANLHQGVHKL